MEPIGKVLKKLRLEKGLSLEDVQKKTKININILSAIEEENFINLSPIYVKGFLKIYSNFLGVNLEDYLSDYKESALATKEPEAKQEPASYLEPSPAKFNFLSTDRKMGIGIIIVLVVIFLSIGIFSLCEVFLFQGRSLPKKNKLAAVVPDRVRKKKLQFAQVQKTTPLVIKSKQVAALPQQYATSEIRLGILAKENCWVTLKADGRLIFHGVLRKGKSESWQAKEKIELSLGNAGAVELVINGERISSLGKRAQARKNILITKEGLTVQ
jgi:cytoskeletal protein RodZ